LQINEALRSITAEDRREFQPKHAAAEKHLLEALQIMDVEKNGLSAAKGQDISVGVTSGMDRYDQRMAQALREWLNGNGYRVDQTSPTLLLRVRVTDVSNEDTLKGGNLESATLAVFVSWRWRAQMTSEIALPPIVGSGVRAENQYGSQKTMFENLAESLAEFTPL
jgi:hypothetical protein